MTLTELYEEYEAKLEQYALRLTGDSQRVDDLVQETFIRAMAHLDLLALLKPYQQRAWLYRTLKNLFIDEQRARQRQAVLAEQLAWDNPTNSYLPPEFAVSSNPFELVPERFRELVEKRFILGMTSVEIARELGIPAPTVRSRLHLAMQEIRSKKS